jgi:Phage integrase family
MAASFEYVRMAQGARSGGLYDFRCHDLRHTWATWQRQAGPPTHDLQRLDGWRIGAMTERCAHLAPDHLAVAVSRPDSLLAGYAGPEMKTAPIAGGRLKSGGAPEIRTLDLRIKSPLLYQLS